jgi:hypothetical protein
MHFLRFVALLLSAFLLYFNYRLYDAPKCQSIQDGQLNLDVSAQLRHLRRAIREENAAEAMQGEYPEGFVFMYAVYALAWADLAANLPAESLSRQNARREMTYSLEAMEGPAARAIFNPHLPLSYGAFYRGWTAYVRGRLIQLSAPGQPDSALVRQFRADCRDIEAALQKTGATYLESYDNQVWPADNIVCFAALALHDRLFEPAFRPAGIVWLQRIKNALDADSQLIPHSFDPEKGRASEGPRGSSQALIQALLPEIDPVFAREQYLKFRKHFLAWRLGLPGFREYPKGRSGRGDIDSGPVVMGIGGVASIVGLRAAVRQGDRALVPGLRNGVAGLLFPTESGGEKRFLFGKLPILDAFTAWSQTEICSTNDSFSGNWRWRFQLFSAALLLGLWRLLRWRRKK